MASVLKKKRMKGFATREKAMWSHCSPAGLLGANASQKAVPPSPPAPSALSKLRRRSGEAGLFPSYSQSSLFSVSMTVSWVQGSMFVPIWLPFLLDPKQLTGRSEHVMFTTISSLSRKHCPGQTGSPRGKRKPTHKGRRGPISSKTAVVNYFFRL